MKVENNELVMTEKEKEEVEELISDLAAGLIIEKEGRVLTLKMYVASVFSAAVSLIFTWHFLLPVLGIFAAAPAVLAGILAFGIVGNFFYCVRTKEKGKEIEGKVMKIIKRETQKDPDWWRA